MTATGQALRTSGQDAVLAADVAVHRNYAEHVEAAIEDLIDTGRHFTAEDIRERIPAEAEAHHPNLLPAVIGGYAGAGRIRRVGYRKTTRPSRRHSVLAVWTGPDPAA